MTAGVRVRPAGIEDLPALVPMFDGYRQFYRQPSEPDRAEAFLADRLRNRDSAIFLAEVGGRPVGFVQLYPTFSSVSIGRAFVLNDLYVVAAARGSGAGRALLEQAARYGREQGALYLELSTEVTNTTAQALYAATGWERESAFHHYSLDLR